jgi:hypothetical protein
MKPVKVSSACRRLRAPLIAAAFAAVWIGAAVPAAGAKEPGVIYEPGSPSYKEYSIPLEEARRDAGGGIRGSIDSRAFGIGLLPRGRTASGSAQNGRKGSHRGARTGRAQRGGGAAESGGLSKGLAEAEAAGAPALWTLVPLLLVLLPALLVGLLLARRGDGGGQTAT